SDEYQNISMGDYNTQVTIRERKEQDLLLEFEKVRELFPLVHENEYQAPLQAEAMEAVAPYIPDANRRRNVILHEFDTIRAIRARMGKWSHQSAANSYELAVFVVEV